MKFITKSFTILNILFIVLLYLYCYLSKPQASSKELEPLLTNSDNTNLENIPNTIVPVWNMEQASNKKLEACYYINSTNNSDTFVPLSNDEELPPDSIYFLKTSCKDGVNSSEECSVEPEIFVPASDNNETFPPDSIYFMETSCKGGLDYRQACCVESAARSNPGRQVNLIFTTIVTKLFVKSSTLKSLLQFRNVRISKIYPAQYVKATPIETLLAREEFKKSYYPVEHSSDVLRVVTLYKYGGIYLDTDVIVTKSFDTLPKNWLTKGTKKGPANGILSFSKDEAGKNFTTAALKLLNATYQPYKYDYNGPKLFRRLVRQVCNIGNKENNYETTCPGITVLGTKNFFPFSWMEWKKYFEPDSGDRVLDEPYTYHFYNYASKNTNITKDSLYAKLAKKFCPHVYKLNRFYFENSNAE